MAKTSYPKVGATTTDAQYSELFDLIVGSGVRDASALAVTADSTGLNVKVAAGFGVASGSAFKSTEVETLTISPNASGNGRIDTIVLRRDFAAGSIVDLAVKTGTPSASPSAPALTQSTTGVWEEPLADVVVANGAATITAANVTDRRRLMVTNVGDWTTATRPTGRRGLIGYNRTTGRWEAHDGTAWANLVPSTFTASAISDPQNLTAGNATRVGGRLISVQPTAPTAPAVDDVWLY